MWRNPQLRGRTHRPTLPTRAISAIPSHLSSRRGGHGRRPTEPAGCPGTGRWRVPAMIPEELPVFAGVAALAVAALFVAGRVSKLAGWAPAGPLVLLAAAPLVPVVPLALGLSLDDVVPLIGLLMLGGAVGWRLGG